MNITIKRQPINQTLIKAVCKNKKYMSPELVSEMLKYNVVTSSQVACLTGVSVASILNSTHPKPSYSRTENRLNRSVLFHTLNKFGEQDNGLVFIVNDKKLHEFILKYNQPQK
jgi:hypothetical protein